jgi:TatD DNase family protein
MLIDTHCHLDDERLYPLAESVISDMAKDGLYCVVTSSSDYESSVCNFALATNNRDVYATVGIHPQEASGRTTAQYNEFCKMAENEKVVAIGEVGLDYYYENSPREIQKTVLVEQMELAHFLRLPLVFHVRDAFGDFFDIVKDNKKLLEYGGCIVSAARRNTQKAF